MAFVGSKSFPHKGGKLVIKSAEVDDADEFLSFINQVDNETDFLTRAPGEFNMILEDEQRFIENKLSSRKDLLLIARFDGRITGTLGFVSNSLLRCNHKGQFGISVLKEYWGFGIGRSLIETMFEWADANGIIKISLEVDTSNTRAISLYRSMGFVEEGYLRMDRLMENHEFRDSLIMARFNPFYVRYRK